MLSSLIEFFNCTLDYSTLFQFAIWSFAALYHLFGSWISVNRLSVTQVWMLIHCTLDLKACLNVLDLTCPPPYFPVLDAKSGCVFLVWMQNLTPKKPTWKFSFDENSHCMVFMKYAFKAMLDPIQKLFLHSLSMDVQYNIQKRFCFWIDVNTCLCPQKMSSQKW